MQSQQTVHPNMEIIRCRHFQLLLNMMLQGLVLGIRQKDQETFYLWKRQPFVVANFVDFRHLKQAFQAQFFVEQLLRLFPFVQILHISYNTSPIRHQLKPPAFQRGPYNLVFILYFISPNCQLIFLFQFYLDQRSLKPLFFTTLNQALLLTANRQDVREGQSFFFCQVFIILLYVKCWSGHQFIFQTALLCIHRLFFQCFPGGQGKLLFCLTPVFLHYYKSQNQFAQQSLQLSLLVFSQLYSLQIIFLVFTLIVCWILLAYS